MPDPRSDIFWSAEHRYLWEALSGLVTRSLAAGTAGGEALLPAPIKPLISWSVVNRAALDYLQWYNFGVLAGVNETTAKAAISLIDEWIQAGDPLSVLQESMATVITDGRAASIATTEVTRIYAEGNKLAWQSTGVVEGRRWNTAMDDLRCPGCAALQGEVAGLNQPWIIDNSKIAASAELQQWVAYFGEVHEIPAHTNCRCWPSPVVTQRALERELERQLAGFER